MGFRGSRVEETGFEMFEMFNILKKTGPIYLSESKVRPLLLNERSE